MFREKIEKATNLTEIHPLCEKIKGLYVHVCTVDNRGLSELEKAKVVAKKSVYAKLYIDARVVFLKIQKVEGIFTRFPEPVPFERLVIQINALKRGKKVKI